MTTLAPCSARASTTALPIPVLPPVTIATLPCSSSVMFHLPGAPAEGAVLSDVLPYRVGRPKAIDFLGIRTHPTNYPIVTRRVTSCSLLLPGAASGAEAHPN